MVRLGKLAASVAHLAAPLTVFAQITTVVVTEVTEPAQPTVQVEQGSETVAWSLGTRLSLFMTSASDVTCPSTLSAVKASSQFAQVQARSKDVVAGDADTSLATTFYFTNGLHEPGTSFDSNGVTSIRVAEPDDVGGGCWSVDGDSLGVQPCTRVAAQDFYVSHRGDNTPFYIFDNSLKAIDRSETGSGPLIVQSSTKNQFCVYATDTEKLVVPTATEVRHVAQKDITNLTASSFGSTLPISEGSIPECTFSIEGDSSVPMLDSLSSADCITARVYASIPSGCDATPRNKTCILHLFPAFCLDLPEVRRGVNASDAVESCFRKISLGPCVANPGGAACASGLFAGISFVDGVGGGGSASKRQASNDPLFGDPDSYIPLEDQFWIGVMKNIINSGIGAFKFFAGPTLREWHVTCAGVTHLSSLFSQDAADSIRSGCSSIFNAFDSVKELNYNNDVEKAGGIFADVVGLLSVAMDVAKAAKAVGAVDALVAKFTKSAATIGETEGLMLEAKEGSNTVQVFRDDGTGQPKLLYTDTDVAAMEKSIEKNESQAFDNCKVCVGPPARLRRRAGILRKLCCFLSPQTIEAPESVWNEGSVLPEAGAPEAIPIAERVVSTISHTDRITDPETKLISTMSEGFAKWYKESQPFSNNMDEVSSLLLEVRKNKADWSKIATATAEAYNLNQEEKWALRMWVEYYALNPAFESAMGKLPFSSGMAIRSTDLTADAVKMLDNLEPGLFSKGKSGVYEVQDLVININTMNAQGADLRKVMATTLDLGDGMFTTTKDYLFAIDSKSGRFVEPVVNGEYRELDFIQGLSGKFKLLGRQDLNGGEAAKLAGKPGPYGIYYFEEVEIPNTAPAVTVQGVRDALTKQGVTLP
ncbi:hypothetical protein AK830_g7922 [Neonectria ditissima]|uniref:Uncharacterized protein n=1 Tax=Neonectria ditissima TaxID=78410 RepID=A0A0N8H6D4_9HYPO|nr:hypothetical protein AK830_g7922 [Neonectria ditissima]